MNYNFSDILKQFLYPFFPRRCALCGEAVSPEIEICEECLNDIEILDEDINFDFPEGRYFIKTVSPFYYGGAIKKCILGLKFGKCVQNSVILSKFMAEAVEKNFNTKYIDIVACVPLTKKKRRRRGFNQSELLAKKIAKEIDVPFEAKALLRSFERAEQKNLSKRDRLYNVKDAFKAKDSDRIKGKRILLCDDIVTTGATLNECARALINGGAREVYCVTAAAAKGR